MKFRKWYGQFYAEPVDNEDRVYAVPPPDCEFQPPKFERAQQTASARHRQPD